MKTVHCDGLGEVTIRPLKLSQRFSLNDEGNDDNMMVVKILHMSVVDAEGRPLKTQDEWDDFGGQHFQSAMSLFKDCMEMNDFDGTQAEKK